MRGFGDYIFDVINFGNLNELVNFLSVYFVLLRMFKLFVNKKMVIFFFVDLIIFGFNWIIEDYVKGLWVFVKIGVDVIVVNESCGYGRFVYYWLI